ncbi:MAG: hypothetical protein CO064_08890 [Anaerolineae bacterium CG_4_9_14_0_8_um_filter_58_9]|nr:MAG: hypothetical protein CO064_08890 [Anaerolineae bacterium CG_4_9_14_0_8_um_filter_58_9]
MTSNLDKLHRLRQGNATWQCAARRAPFWIMPKDRPPYRPFIILVVDQDTELIYKTDIQEERPTPEAILEILFKAMQGTLLNLWHRGRPARILVDDAKLAQVLAPRLAELEIRCDYRATLPQANSALLEMEEHATKRKPIPGLLSIPGVTVPLAAEFFAAAADYYRQKPWRWMENWLPIAVRYPPDGRARYALVLGRGGETYGLSVYESLEDVDIVLSDTSPEKHAPLVPWFSLVLDEATGMSFADLDAIEQYGWPVAGEKAYPMAIKATPKSDWGELPSASELAWLAAALRVLPDFVTRHLHAERGMPRPAHATYSLSGVHGGQKIALRFPAEAQSTPPDADTAGSSNADQDADMEELEKFIQDWHWDEASHEIARQMGAFLFQFLDHLEASGLSRQTMRKHESNCWCIGWLECGYGYHDSFTPAIFLGGPSYENEFRRKVSDSKYALNSYRATWRKLERYVLSLGYEESW